MSDTVKLLNPYGLPWHAVESGRVGTDCLYDFNDEYVATVPKYCSKYIVESVNRGFASVWSLPIASSNALLREQRNELRDLCVLLFDAVKHGNQVVDLPGIWNKAEEVLKRTDPEKQP